MNDHISAGRALMGDSLGFHLLLIIIGVGLPLLISLAELYGLVRRQPRAIELAHTWSRALVVLFIAGAVSGTIISLQFDLLWPTFMKFIGQTAGLAFVLEGTMFMIEAVFLSVYMLSWQRLRPWVHWLVGLPVVIGSLGSAVFITTANAFMNKPAGFSIGANGQPVDVHVADVLFTRTAYIEVIHSIPAYICTAALVLLAVYAWLYRQPRHAHDRSWIRQVMLGLAAVALLFGLLVGVAGDMSARYLASYEPYKLAAAEGLMRTQRHAPLIIGGIVSGGHIKYGLEIPSLLSFLAGHHFGAEVVGLDKTPPADRPSLVIHYFFDGMVAAGMAVVGVPLLFLAAYRWRRQWAFKPAMLWLLMLAAVCGVLATELGWMLTELGRQPYVIYGYMRTADALTTSAAVVRLGFVFPLAFMVLLALTVVVLRKTMRHRDGVRG